MFPTNYLACVQPYAHGNFGISHLADLLVDPGRWLSAFRGRRRQPGMRGLRMLRGLRKWTKYGIADELIDGTFH